MRIIFVFLFFINTNSLFSHGGGLNAEGCHNNKRTSDYHCHRKKTKTYQEKPKYEKKETNNNRKYNRKSFKYNSYPTNTNKGFYTQKKCNTNIDHVVSLKDAHTSGASDWENNVKEKFANDKLNHVASCTNINSSKGSSTPKDFLRKSRDGKGLEYSILPVCSYLEIYYKVKLKYDLSFSANDPELFLECGLNTKIQVNKHSIIE